MSKSFEQILSEAVESVEARRRERRADMMLVAEAFGHVGVDAENLVDEMEAAFAGR